MPGPSEVFFPFNAIFVIKYKQSLVIIKSTTAGNIGHRSSIFGRDCSSVAVKEFMNISIHVVFKSFDTVAEKYNWNFGKMVYEITATTMIPIPV